MMDDRLHAERVGPDRSKAPGRAEIDELPDGVFITGCGRDGSAWLVLGNELLAWSPGGYRNRRRRPRGEVVTVLTPESTISAIRSGYEPEIHRSAWSR